MHFTKVMLNNIRRQSGYVCCISKTSIHMQDTRAWRRRADNHSSGMTAWCCGHGGSCSDHHDVAVSCWWRVHHSAAAAALTTTAAVALPPVSTTLPSASAQLLHWPCRCRWHYWVWGRGLAVASDEWRRRGYRQRFGLIASIPQCPRSGSS